MKRLVEILEGLGYRRSTSYPRGGSNSGVFGLNGLSEGFVITAQGTKGFVITYRQDSTVIIRDRSNSNRRRFLAAALPVLKRIYGDNKVTLHKRGVKLAPYSITVKR